MKFAEKEVYDPSKDETYANPVIDRNEMQERTLPDGTKVSFRFLHGRFEGTNVKFSFCCPSRENYQGHFFQHISPFPGPDEEMAAFGKTGQDDIIAFCITHGAIYVECNMGSSAVFGSESDSTIFYKSNAAAGAFCKKTAENLYGPHRTYGYCFGGSGGGFKTMSCIENTNVYDGAVPFVIGSPMALPNVLCVEAHGARMLRNKWKDIVDAMEPGGNGNPYETLNEEEAAALHEISRMGFPYRQAVEFGTTDDGALPVLAPVVSACAPTYFEDFWTKEGFLGTEENSSAKRDRISIHTEVVNAFAFEEKKEEAEIDSRNGTDDAWQKMMAEGNNCVIEVKDAPEGDDLYLRGVDIIFESGEAAGKKLRLGYLNHKMIIPGVSYGSDDAAEVIKLVKPGDKVFLDNSDYIAIQTYYRHQVPDDLSFHAWDQFRDENGKAIYPQYPVIGPGFTTGGCGSVQDGKIQGRVFVMNSLMDGDWPWQADWYRRKVEEVNGEAAKDMFRIYYNDNCPHGDVSEVSDKTRYCSYLGQLNQALLDLSAWCENETKPADSTGYRIEEGQVILSETKEERNGIQPMVKVLANGSECVKVKAGETVRLEVEVECPKGAGMLESVSWCFDGENFEEGEQTKEHVFTEPGTYFPAVLVCSNRNWKDPFTKLRNLGRVRVIVE